jgi:hypothetical protein
LIPSVYHGDDSERELMRSELNFGENRRPTTAFQPKMIITTVDVFLKDQKHFALGMRGIPSWKVRIRHFNAISTPFQRHFHTISTPFQRHFHTISTPFQRHFNAISTPFQRHFNAIIGLEGRDTRSRAEPGSMSGGAT